MAESLLRKSLYDVERRNDPAFTSEDVYRVTNGEEGELVKGLRRGVAASSASSMAEQALAAEVAQDPAFNALRQQSEQIKSGAEPLAAKVGSLRDVGGVEDAIDFAVGMTGQGVASMAPTLGAALLPIGRGRALAALGAGYQQSRSEAISAQYDDPALAATSAEDRSRAATGVGLASAGLEAAVPLGLAKTAFGPGKKAFGAGVAQDLVGESLTETAQTGVQFAGEKYLDPNQQADPWDFADAAVGGGLTGAAVGGTVRGAATLADRVGSSSPAPEVAPTPEPVDLGPSKKGFVADTLDKFNSPSDFLKSVFRPRTEDQAANDLAPDGEDPDILKAADPAAAMAAKDASRAERAATYAEDLFNDPNTPDAVKAKVAEFGGDFSTPAAQDYVTRTLVTQRGGEKLSKAVTDFVDVSKDLFDKAKDLGGKVADKASEVSDAAITKAQDKIVKKNLQDIDDSQIKPLVDVLASRLGNNKADAPDLARKLVAAASRLRPDAQITEDVERRLRSFTDAVDDEVIETISKVSGNTALRSTIAKIRAIPSAMADLRQGSGSSFFESMITVPDLPASTLPQLAEAVDQLGPKLKGMNTTQKQNALKDLAPAFGSVKNAQVVVEYYGNLKREAFKLDAENSKESADNVDAITELFLDPPDRASDATYEDAASVAEWNVLTENDGPEQEIGFRSGPAKRPFRKFAGEKLSDGKTRREAVRAIKDARGREDADYATMDYGQYLASQGVDAKVGLDSRRRDIEGLIAEHKSHKGEDRSAQINALKGELSLIEATVERVGEDKALDALYEVTTRSQKNEKDYIASDDDLKSMKIAVRARPDTIVEFKTKDGKTLKLSAESMIKTLGSKRKNKGGVQNPNKQTAAQTFADAVASVLAREDIAAITSDLEKVVIDSKANQRAERSYNSKRLAAANDYKNTLDQKGKGVPARRKFIREQLQALESDIEDLGSPDAANFDEVGFEESREQWTARAKDIQKTAQARVEAADKARVEAREAYETNKNKITYQAFEDARAAFDFARNAALDYKGFAQAVSDQFYDVQRQLQEAEKSGVPGGDNEAVGEDAPRNSTSTDKPDLSKTRTYAAPPKRDLPEPILPKKPSLQGPSKALPGPKSDAKKIVVDEIMKTRGKDVQVEVDKLVKDLGGSGEYEFTPATGERIVRVAIDAMDVLGTARHEAFHDFFRMLGAERWARSAKTDLFDAVKAPHVKKQLRELLKAHPKALEQLEQDPEEALAYAYQFWAAGMLKMGPIGTSTFQKILRAFRELIGVVSEGDSAEAIFDSLKTGDLADMSVAQQVISERREKTLGQRMRDFSPAVADVGRKLIETGTDRLRDFGTGEARELADDFEKFTRERFRQDALWQNKFARIIADTTPTERAKALRNLQKQNGPTPGNKLEENIDQMFKDLHDYMAKANVMKDGKPINKVIDYFPRAWDRDAIAKDRDGWIKLNAKHGMDIVAAAQVADAIMAGSGQLELAENENHLGYVPYVKASQSRKMWHITPKNAHEFVRFQQGDLADVVTGYIKQASHRAEYARIFDDGGGKITRVAATMRLKGEELKDFTNTVRALEGTLSPDLTYDTKALMSTAMTVQNLVLLPLAIFSQMLDPIVLAARSENLKDAGEAFTTAIKRAFGKKVDGEDLAEMLGIISQDSVLDAMGMAYGSSFQGKLAAKINRGFFKYNGMQGWNNSMRIAATVAGERYILANKNNKRALEELGLRPSDIKTMASFVGQQPNAKGKVTSRERLDTSSEAVKRAMYQFVDGAVLRPSATSRPVWMSDPRFMLVGHLKQFTFAMHNVVLKRAMNELDNDNIKPMATLMLTMPVILAADIVKSVLTGTPNMEGWGFVDYVTRAVERSGLLGLNDFVAQSAKGVEMGKAPGEALLGPTVENLLTILRWVQGDPRTELGDVAERTIPGARLL